MKTAKSTRKHIDLSEAAKILGVDYQTAYGYARAGRFECFQYCPGGRIRTTRRAVLEFKAAHRMGQN